MFHFGSFVYLFRIWELLPLRQIQMHSLWNLWVNEQQWVKLNALNKGIEIFSPHLKMNSYQIYIHKLNSILNMSFALF